MSWLSASTDRHFATRRVSSLVGVIALLAGALTVAAAGPASAAPTTFTVQTAGNAVSSGAADGICDASAAAGTQCTLKEAIKESNANPGMDTIGFDTAAFATPYRITITSAGMSPITDPVLIDGTTQPGFDPSNGKIVRYDGNTLTSRRVEQCSLAEAAPSSRVW